MQFRAVCKRSTRYIEKLSYILFNFFIQDLSFFTHMFFMKQFYMADHELAQIARIDIS